MTNEEAYNILKFLAQRCGYKDISFLPVTSNHPAMFFISNCNDCNKYVSVWQYETSSGRYIRTYATLMDDRMSSIDYPMMLDFMLMHDDECMYQVKNGHNGHNDKKYVRIFKRGDTLESLLISSDLNSAIEPKESNEQQYASQEN